MISAQTGQLGQLAQRDTLGVAFVEETLGAVNGKILVSGMRQGNAGSAVAVGQLVKEGKGEVVPSRGGSALFEGAMSPHETHGRARIFDEAAAKRKTRNALLEEMLDGTLQSAEVEEDTAEIAVYFAIGVHLARRHDG